MEITLASIEDTAQILSLQKLAYQSEAEIYNDFSIPPLTQTIEEIKKEFENLLFLRATEGENIIGSVRAYTNGSSCFVGRLIVHPNWQRRGVGTMLMKTIEKQFTEVQRYEIFTGVKSEGNIRLYKKLGYIPFKDYALSESVTLIYMEKLRT